MLSSSSGVSNERQKFMELVKKEIDRIQDETERGGGSSLRFSNRGVEAWRPTQLPENHISMTLQDRVSRLMHKIEEDLDKADAQIGEKLKLCDLDNDGVVTAFLWVSLADLLGLRSRTRSSRLLWAT